MACSNTCEMGGNPIADDPRFALAADGGPRHVQTYKLSDYLFGAEDDPAILSSIPLAEDGVDAPLAVPEG